MMQLDGEKSALSSQAERSQRVGGYITLVATLLIGTMVVIATGFASLVA